MYDYKVTLTKEVFYKGTLIIQAESQSDLNEKIELLMPGIEFKIDRIVTQIHQEEAGIVNAHSGEPDLDLS